MIPVLVLDELAAVLREANKEFYLTDEAVKNNVLVVSPDFLEKVGGTSADFYPYIVLQLTKGDDSADGSYVTARLHFGTYASDGGTGWRELAHLIENTRQTLLKNRTIANKFRLELPIHWEFAEKQALPAWSGFMDVKYAVAQPQEELNIEYGKRKSKASENGCGQYTEVCLFGAESH